MQSSLVADVGTTLEQGILRAVAYADIFDFPLTAPEIHRYTTEVRASPQEVAVALAALVPDHLERRGPLYFLPGRSELVERRRRRAEVAAVLWPTAHRYAGLIAALPFVRMVAVTGALARDNVDPGADVDYFIIAEPGRVWVCRALVGLLTRWAARQRVTLCANYVLAEDRLALSERDLYTAYELVQMVPVVGAAAYRRLRRENTWVAWLLPNAPNRSPRKRPRTRQRDSEIAELRPGTARRLAETTLRSPAGAWLDRLERARKLRKSIREDRDLSESRFEPGCFKGHFDAHGRRTLEAFAQRLRGLDLPALEKGVG